MIGSTARSDHTPRLFLVTVPDIEVFFSGTGDMFAALTVARFREAASAAQLLDTRAWMSPDEVDPLRLPLARAVEKVCASMHLVLEKTKMEMDREVGSFEVGSGDERKGIEEKEMHLRKTKAAEVRVVQYQDQLRNPDTTFKAQEVIR